MNPLWDEAMLQRLRKAARRQNPPQARRALRQHYHGFFQRWRGDLTLISWSALLGVGFLCLGLLAPEKFPLRIATGFVAQNWYLAACAFAGLMAAACHKSWPVPEILAMAPVPPEFLGQAAHRGIRRQILFGVLSSLFFTGAVFAVFAANCAHRGMPFHHGWAGAAATAFWLHLIGTAGTLPLLRHLVRRPKPEGNGPSGILANYLLLGGSVFSALALLAMIIAPLTLDGKFGSIAAELGEVYHQILAPSGLLLWPTQPSAVPVWQLFLTGALLLLSFPSAKRLWTAFQEPPVVRVPDPDFYRSASPDDWEDWEEDAEGSGELSLGAAGPGSDPSGQRMLARGFTVPCPAAPLTEEERREAAGKLRHAMDDSGMRSDLLFSPHVDSWRGPWPTGHRPWIMILLPVFAGAAWGNLIGLLAGWAWLTIHVILMPQAPPPFARLLMQYPNDQALHRELPLSLEPTWTAIARHLRNTMLAYFATALIFPIAGWLLSLLADLPGDLWPWPRFGFRSVGFHQIAAAAAVVIATGGVMRRALGPVNFGDQVNKRKWLCSGWQFFGYFPWLITWASLAATAAGSGVLLSMIFSNPAVPSLFYSLRFLLAGACLATGEGLRGLCVRLVFWQWARARKC